MTIHLDWLKTGRAPRGTPRRRRAPAAPARPGADRRPGDDRRRAAIRAVQQLRELQFLRLPQADHRAGSSIGRRAAAARASSATRGVEYCGALDRRRAGATTVGPMYSPGMGTSDVPSTVPAARRPDHPQPELEPAVGEARARAGHGLDVRLGRRPDELRDAAVGDEDRRPARFGARRPAGPRSSRPAQEIVRRRRTRRLRPTTTIPLDHLPPLALPGEVTQSATASPAPPAARPEGKSGGAPATASACRRTRRRGAEPPRRRPPSRTRPRGRDRDRPVRAGRPDARRRQPAVRRRPGLAGGEGLPDRAGPPAVRRGRRRRSSPRPPAGACATSPCRSTSSKLDRRPAAPGSSSSWPRPRPGPCSSSMPTGRAPAPSGTSAASRSIASTRRSPAARPRRSG